MPDQILTIQVLEALANAIENGYGEELREMSVSGIVVDLLNYADLGEEAIRKTDEIADIVKEWKAGLK